MKKQLEFQKKLVQSQSPQSLCFESLDVLHQFIHHLLMSFGALTVDPPICRFISFWWSDLYPCSPTCPCWCQSLVLEVILEGLRQREALDLLKSLPTHRQAGRTPTQVH